MIAGSNFNFSAIIGNTAPETFESKTVKNTLITTVKLIIRGLAKTSPVIVLPCNCKYNLTKLAAASTKPQIRPTPISFHITFNASFTYSHTTNYHCC